tara:strand:- start:88 stop:606 length:519 start_codon:yes stop_codon:yes gene_type:complete
MSIIIDPNVQQASISIDASSFGGSLPSGVNSSLMEIKYSYPAFNQSDLSNFVPGEVIVLRGDSNSNNIYNCKAEKATTANNVYASKMLFIFVQYYNNTLIVMHKGYMDYEQDDEKMQNWVAGQTIYMHQNRIDTQPANAPGAWVKSIGFCMPNSENKKRIWFEPDSTYLILQ